MVAVALSASLYALAFIFPVYFSWTSYLWLFLIWCYNRTKKLSFAVGAFWGAIFFSMHMSWIGYIICSRGSGYFRIIVYLLTVVYFSAFSGMWFAGQQYLYNLVVYQSQKLSSRILPVFYLCLWFATTTLFLSIVQYTSLWILGNCEGYPFIHPLLPLITYAWCKNLVAWTGSLVAWVIIFLLQAFLYVIFLYRSKVYAFLLFCLFALFCFLGPVYEQTSQFPFSMCYISPCEFEAMPKLTPAQVFYAISRVIDAKSNSNFQFIVMPESSFPFDLEVWSDYLCAWTSLLHEQSSIILGAHRKTADGSVYNCVYVIRNGLIVQRYDKRHLVFFTERIPKWFGELPFFTTLFTSNDNVFCLPCNDAGDAYSDVIVLDGKSPMQLFVCSELYFEAKKAYGTMPILFLTNDDWFGLPYAQNLAHRYALLFAVQSGVSLIYVATHRFDILQ